MQQNPRGDNLQVYAALSTLKVEPPQNEMNNGVIPLDTLPAGWWNWLWNAITQAQNDAHYSLDTVYQEINAVLTHAGITPNPEQFDQLKQAIIALRAQIATAVDVGSVLSTESGTNGSVKVASDGKMTVNGFGDLQQLQTLMKDTLVEAINEIFNTVTTLDGELTAAEGRLDTAEGRLDTAEGRLDDAEGRLDTVDSNIGTMNDLETTDKSSLVSAINELKAASGEGAASLEGRVDAIEGNIGTMNDLETIDKSSLVSAINETFYRSMYAERPFKTAFTDYFQERTETELPYVETILCTDFSGMYYDCANLTKLQQPIGVLDTRQGTNFARMFAGCTALQTIPALNTSKGTDFGSMFSGCTALQTIPALNTSKGTDFGSMFSGCVALQTIPALDISSGTSFLGMFQNCRALTAMPALNASNGRNFGNMFSGCVALQTIPALDTRQGVGFTEMFRGCKALQTIPALDTRNVTTFTRMFQGCTALQTIPALDVSQGTGVLDMFDQCTALTTFTENPLLGDTVPWQFGKNINFSACPLDKASILQVFNGLKTGISATIRISSTTNGYLTEEDKGIATNKGWYVRVG